MYEGLVGTYSFSGDSVRLVSLPKIALVSKLWVTSAENTLTLGAMPDSEKLDDKILPISAEGLAMPFNPIHCANDLVRDWTFFT